MEKRRMISDAARELEVEAHVLRYWEEELQLPIPRNEMGHRYYGDQEMKLLEEVKKQKQKGIPLKEMKQRIHQMTSQPQEVIVKREADVIPFPNDQNEKMEQFQEIMVKIVGQALKNHEDSLSKQMGQRVANQVVKEMDYHFRVQEEIEENRYKKFDEMVRTYQQKSRLEAAVTREGKAKKGFFWKKRRRDI